MTEEDFNLWNNKLLSTEPEKQRSFIVEKINEIHKSLPKTLLKNKNYNTMNLDTIIMSCDKYSFLWKNFSKNVQ